MKQHQKITLVLTIFFVLFLFIDPVYAGPGGTVAKALFKTWWGKLIMSVLAIILLPLIFYVRTIEFIAI